MRTARSLVRKRQVEICDWLGFPARPSTVNILRKMPPDDVRILSLLDLRDALWEDEVVNLLQHLKSIPGAAIKIVSRPYCRAHFSAKFLHELSELGDAESDWEKRDKLEWAMQGRILREIPGRVFHSFSQIENFSRVRGAEARRNRSSTLEGVFPKPPLEGDGNICPLVDGEALRNEALEMEHCVAEYFDSAMSGDMAFYRILSPERATFALVFDKGVWRLGQVSGYRNATVSQETYGVIYRWLSCIGR
jgi:hypothetical protein